MSKRSRGKRVKILVLNWILQHEGLRFSQDSLIHFHGGLELDKSRGPSILVSSGSGERMLVAAAQNPYIRSGWHAAEGLALPPASNS